MKGYVYLLCAVILLGLLTGPAAAQLTPAEEASQLAVTAYEVDPAVFIYGDTGTIKVTVTNTGTTPVAISRVKLYSNDLSVYDDGNYDSVGTIGAGNSLAFTFTVVADTLDGIYYPFFYVDLRDAGSLRYRIPVTVDSTGLTASVMSKPDVFSPGKKEEITILVGNPRENTVNAVEVVPIKNGYTTVQTASFIGTLVPDQAAEVTFEATPSEETVMTFAVNYRNGINDHQTLVDVPVVFGEDKKRAEIVLNNIVVESSGTSYMVTGDVTNAGLEDAKSVVITVAEPGIPVDPYRSYVVGALEPDDFAGFEVTFDAEPGEEVPLVAIYKDVDGNIYEDEILLTTGAKVSDSRPVADSGMPVLWIGLVIVIVAVVGGIIFYSWKKR
ncbi:hypothetical protein AZH53_09115 [Methanomicrobiaceae archaeon CYW5]|uniref:CARDB domain-containing protein n=1 Tax=Methanovulcanius yangii TaxID=1789227 RepID=UPI0029CA5CFE|nr:CARDB domain-containing protein [Methanovulcanius yangii]MBT8508563.1 hypothetical protein [Methanovulcanius yangii]